jgi:hypothetical protein
VIIRVSGADPETARSSLGELARNWGHELTPVTTGTPTPPDLDHDGDTKAVDPLSLAALVLSIPSAALAVVELADRITKRRRAMELITTPTNWRAAGRDRGHRQGSTRDSSRWTRTNC